MSLFKKKTDLVHHITYMGLMTAINLVFIVIAQYVPLMIFLLVLLLPFASAVVSYYCLKRYYPIYAAASIGLCMIFSISDTIFCVIPALVCGFIIGLLIELKIHPFWMILSTTIVNAGLSYAFIPLINLISGTNIVNSLLEACKLDASPYRTELVYLSIFFISLMQCSLTHFILLSDAKKIGIEINTRVASFAPYVIGLEISLVAALCLSFIFFPLALVFLIISFGFATFLIADLLASKKLYIYLLMTAAVFVAVLFFALFYKQIIKPYGLMLSGIFPLLIGVISFVNYCLLKNSSNI